MSATVRAEDHVYLIGGTPYPEFVEFMLIKPLDPGPRDKITIANEWRAAAVQLKLLELKEPGWADHPPLLPLPDEAAPLVAQVEADPVYQRSFKDVPSELGLVELDRLVVRQNTINLAQVERLKERLGATPNAEAIFRLCLPFDHPTVSARIRTLANNGFEFISDSNDIRLLESVVLRPEQLRDFQTRGTIAGVAGAVIGYGSNYLNVIAVENRLVLNNGSHRAYTLRTLGVSRVPCVIQRVANRQELHRVAVGMLKSSPDLYLKESRPPVLKDYFDPQLAKTVRLLATCRHVRVRVSVESVDLPWKPGDENGAT